MKHEVKAIVVKRQRTGHVGTNDRDVIALTLRDLALACKLALRVVEHGAHGPARGKDGHLLAAARGKPQHVRTLEVAQPFVWNGLGGREQHVPLPRLCSKEGLMRDRPAPLPALLDPPVDCLGVDVLI